MCEKYFDDISLLVDDMLDDATKNDLLTHLDTCADCKQVYNNLLALRDALTDLDDIEYPEDLHQSIMSKIEAVREDSTPKVIKIDFRSKALYAVASFVGIMVFCTPIISNMMMSTTPKTTVMASDLELVDHVRLFGENPILQKSISVSVTSDNVEESFAELTEYASGYGEVTNANNLDNVATFTVETDTENAPQLVSYIVDNYNDTKYVTSKTNLSKELEELETKVSANTEVTTSKFEQEKQMLIDKSKVVSINVTIHN